MTRTTLALLGAITLGVAGFGTMALIPSNSALAESAPTLRTQMFSIENMTCAACPITVKTAMEHVSGVKSVKVDFAAKTATVVFDPSHTTIAAIAAASTNAGYPAHASARKTQ